MQEQLSEILFYIKGGLRYKWLGFFLAWGVCLAGWAYVLTLSNKYESSAKIHIDTYSMLQPLLQGMAIQGNTHSMIRIIKQLIFSRDNLETIIKLAHIKEAEENQNIGHSQLLKKLKEIIIIQGNNKSRLFNILCETENSKLSKNIVDAVLTVFSEQSQQRSLGDVDLAQHFIDGQIQDYEIRLKDAEKARENFKRDNLLKLSGEGGQLGQLQTVKTQLEEALLALEQAESRYTVIMEQMEDILESSEDWGLDDFSEATEQKSISRITLLQDERKELLLKYKEKHPAVKAIDSLIVLLKQQKQEEPIEIIEEYDGNEVLLSADDLTNPYVLSLQVSLNEAEANVAVTESTVFMLQQRIETIGNDIDNRLLIETKIKSLNRDYSVIQGNYNQLLERRELAHISEKVDNETAALRFKIIESPKKALFPTSPNRKKLNSLILLAGLFLGVTFPLFLGLLTPTFMSIKQIRTSLEIPVLGSVSVLDGELIMRQKKFKTRLYIFGFLTLLFFYILAMVIGMLQSGDVNAITRMVGRLI